MPRAPLRGEDARRFSAFRQIAKAFAPLYLGRTPTRGPAAGHLEEAFADAAAAIAIFNADPGTTAVARLARLRETGLARAQGIPDPSKAPATHVVLASVMSLGGYLKAPDARTALTSPPRRAPDECAPRGPAPARRG